MEHSKEVNDCKHLIKTLIMGNKLSSLIILFELVFEISMLRSFCFLYSKDIILLLLYFIYQWNDSRILSEKIKRYHIFFTLHGVLLDIFLLRPIFILALFSVRNEDYHLEHYTCTFTPITGAY